MGKAVVCRMLVSASSVLRWQCLKPYLQSTPSTSRAFLFSSIAAATCAFAASSISGANNSGFSLLHVTPCKDSTSMKFQPLLVYIYEHRAHQALEGLCRREHPIALVRRLISSLARSCTLLVRRRMWPLSYPASSQTTPGVVLEVDDAALPGRPVKHLMDC